MDRVHASAVVDVLEVDRLLASGVLTQSTHPAFGYRILNYTSRAVFNRAWTDTVERCRGLVLDAADHVVARPMRKFHNYGAVRPPNYVLTREPMVFDKLDGSLGIVVPTPTGSGEHRHIVATRGSFVSEQALHATAIWQERYAGVAVPDSATFLVEILYPHNRIVVDNGDIDDLVLIAVIDNATGADVPLWNVDWPGLTADVHRGLDLDNAYRYATGTAKQHAEGVVLVWTHPNRESYRLKVKHPEYVRRHAAIFGLSTLSLWRRFSAGATLEETLADLPDEAHAWTRGHAGALLGAHAALLAQFSRDAATVPVGLTPPQRAAIVQRFEHPAPVFMLLRGSDPADYAWKQLRPDYEPFRVDASET